MARTSVYIVPTHRWYIERTVWLIAGIALLTSSALALLIDPRWILAVTATGLVSINVAITGFCPVGNALRLFGFTPMLGTTAPMRWNLYIMQTDRWYLERRIYLIVGFNISVASMLVLTNSLWWSSFIILSEPRWFGSQPRVIASWRICCIGLAPNHASILKRRLQVVVQTAPCQRCVSATRAQSPHSTICIPG